MNRDIQKVLILGLIFFIFVVVVHKVVFQVPGAAINSYLTSDAAFHWNKINGDCNESNCLGYPPLFHELAKPFSYRIETMFYFYLFLAAFVAPLLIYFITRHWISALFYFSITNFFWYTQEGFFPMGLCFILLIGMIATKRYWIRIILLALAMTAHSHGIYLGLVLFLALLIQEHSFEIKNYFGGWLLGCSKIPWLDNARYSALKGIVAEDNTILRTVGLQVGSVLSALIKTTPFPFLAIAVYQFWKEKYYGFILTMLGTFFVINTRAALFAGLLMVIGVTFFYSQRPNKIILFGRLWPIKKIMIAFALALLAIQIYCYMWDYSVLVFKICG